MRYSNRRPVGCLLGTLGITLVVLGVIVGLGMAITLDTLSSAVLVPLVMIGIGVVLAFGGDRLMRVPDLVATSGIKRVAPLSWTIFAVMFVVFGVDGFNHVARPMAWDDPGAWCLGVYGLAGLVMIAYGVHVQIRFRRMGRAATRDETPLVIASDRVGTVLFLLGLTLAEPLLVFNGFAENTWQDWLAPFGAGAWVVGSLRNVKRPPAPTVIDAEGIEAPAVWTGRIRWRDLEDIRVGTVVTQGRIAMNVQCLAFIFRDGVPLPERVQPQKALDAQRALGCFNVKAPAIGLPLREAVSGLKMRLERYRRAHQTEPDAAHDHA